MRRFVLWFFMWLGVGLILDMALIGGINIENLAKCLSAVVSLWLVFMFGKFENFLDARFIAVVGFLFYLVISPLGAESSYGQFSAEVYEKAWVLVVIAFLGLFCSSFLWTKKKVIPIIGIDSVGPYLLSALTFLAIGYMLFIIDTSRFGGPLAIISLKKIDRMSAMSEAFGNLPFDTFINVGALTLAYIIFSSTRPELTRKLMFVTFLLLSPYIFYRVLQGDRTSLIQTFFPIFTLIFVAVFRKVPKKTYFLVIGSFIIFSVLGNIRGAISYSFQEGSWKPVVSRIRETNLSWFYPREFSGTYYTLTSSVHLENEFGDPKMLGSSYIQAFPSLLPRTIYPGEKPLTLSHAYGERISRLVGRDRRFGAGFSPVAESYLNFGEVGVFFCFLLFGIFADKMMGLLDSTNHFVRLWYFTALPGIWFWYRSAFASFVSLIFMTTFSLVIYFSMVEIFRLLIKNEVISLSRLFKER